MAAGDVTLFEGFVLAVGKGVHDLSSDTIMCALITSSATAPDETEADPRWGAGGSRDFSSDEVTPGGEYSTGGISIGTTSWTISSNKPTFDADTDPSWAQDASNPTNARYAILWNDSATNDEAIGFIDLGQTIDMSAAPLDITFDANGIFDLAAV